MSTEAQTEKKVEGKVGSNLAMLDKSHQYTIDAAGKTLGRIASEVAKALMGKTRADYTPHINSGVVVTVQNASKLYIREKKRLSKTYTRYSGYPGGLKKQSLSQMVTQKGNAGPLRKAVERMLPRNTMRTVRMKNLKIND